MLPLMPSGEIHVEALGRHIERLLEAGVSGLWINGTSGEFHALTADERAQAVALVVDQVQGRVPVVAHAGDTSTPRVIAHARAAIEAGADFIAAVPPYYLAYTQAELIRHYALVAEAIHQPLVLYNFPRYCKVSLEVNTVVELARVGLAIGIKESGASFEPFRQLVPRVRSIAPEFRCFHGSSSMPGTTLHLGGHGIICGGANVLPHRYAALVAHARSGNWPGVHTEQQEINRVLDALKAGLSNRPPGANPLVAGMKWLLHRQGLFPSATLREPSMPITDEEQHQLEQRLGPLIEVPLH